MNTENTIPLFKWQLIFLLLTVISSCTESEPITESTLTVEKVEVIEISFKRIRGGENELISRVNRPYFDENNQLHWNNDYLNLEGCKTSYPCSHEVLLINPRVEICSCSDEKASWERLIGLDEQKKIIWQRELIKGSFYDRVIGATPQAIVLTTLEVIEPKSGTILEPSLKTLNGKGARYAFHQATATFRRKAKDFIFFDAEYLLFSAPKGGLYLFNPKQEIKELIRKGTRNSNFIFRRHLNVRNIALSKDERFAFLAQMWETRGPSYLEFAIFDLEKNKLCLRNVLKLFVLVMLQLL